MARAIDNTAVLSIVQTLLDFNATEKLGMSIPEIASSTQLSDRRVRTIVNRPELGFREAQSRSLTGAVTYYHDLSLMTSGSTVSPLNPVQWEDTERLQYIVTCLANALHAVDPMHHLIAEATLDHVKGDKGKDYFDWLLSEEQMKWLARKAKSDKKFQGKYIIQNNLDNLARFAYNGPAYLTRMVDDLKDAETAIKIGMYFILTGFTEAAWKDNTVSEDVTKITPDED